MVGGEVQKTFLSEFRTSNSKSEITSCPGGVRWRGGESADQKHAAENCRASRHGRWSTERGGKWFCTWEKWMSFGEFREPIKKSLQGRWGERMKRKRGPNQQVGRKTVTGGVK